MTNPESGDLQPNEINDSVENSKRDLLKSLAKGAYVAPIALGMMTTKANAASFTDGND